MPDYKDQQLGQILTLDFMEKLCRLDAFLRRAAATARRQDAQVVRSFIQASEAIALASRKLFTFFGDAWPLDETEYIAAVQLLNNCFLDS